MIYIFEVRLRCGNSNLRPLVECIEGKDANDARKKIENEYQGDWKPDNITLIGSRKTK